MLRTSTVPRCLVELDSRRVLCDSAITEIAEELHTSQRLLPPTPPEMAARSPMFPSGHILLAVLLLFWYISPTNAFGAGNIGRTSHQMPIALPSHTNMQRRYPRSRGITGVMVISRTCSRPLPVCKATNGIR